MPLHAFFVKTVYIAENKRLKTLLVSISTKTKELPSVKVTVQFETKENGQNEIVNNMDRSEVKLINSEKIYFDISYTRDFETEKFHRKWVWGGAKTLKSFFLETIFMIKLWDTRGSNSGSFLSTDLKFGGFMAK